MRRERPDDDPLARWKFQTSAVNVPVRDGEVTSADLLLTPEVVKNGMPGDPKVLHSKTFAD